MMDTIEIIGKSYEEALQKALTDMQCTQEDVNVEILEEANKGFLGIGARDAKLRVTLKFPAVSRAKSFLEQLFVEMNMKIEIQITADEAAQQIFIEIQGENMGILIGRGGETLDAIQYLTSLAVNKGDSPYVRVSLDTENYRQKREGTLERLAKKMADRVLKSRRSITLEPMNANERRIIHSVLHDSKTVTTYSVGEEPHRKIVVSMKRGNAHGSRDREA